MAEYDGSVKFDTEMDTDGFYAGIKKMSAKTVALNNAIKQTKSQISQIKNEMQKLKTETSMTDEYKFMNDSLTSAQKKLETLEDRKQKLRELGRTKGSGWNALIYDIENVREEIASTTAEMQRMQASGDAFEIKDNSVPLRKKQAQLDKLNGKMKVYNRRLQEAKQKESGMTAQVGKIKKLSAALSKLIHSGGSAGRGFAGIGGMLGMFTNRIGSLALLAMLFNQISRGLSKIREEMVNCLATNTQYSRSLAQIKGNMYTAFYPIYSYALPAINALMSGLSRITGTIAAFTSKLFGTSLSKSQQAAKSLYNQAKAIDSVGSAAKKASGNLADIDDMHILTDNSDSGGGSTGSAQAVSFGEIQTDPNLEKWLDKMKVKFKPLTEAVTRLVDAAKPLAGPFLEGLIDGLTDIITSKTAVGIINKIAEALENMDPDEAYAIGKAIGDVAAAIMLMVGIAGFATFVGNVAALWEILLPMGTFLAGWKIGNGLYELITGEDIDMTMWEQLDEIFGTLFNDSETFFDGLGWMCYDAIKNLTEKITGEALPSWQEFKDGVAEVFGESGILGIIKLATAGWLLQMGVDSNMVKNIMSVADIILNDYKRAFSEDGLRGVFRQFGQYVTTFFAMVGNEVKASLFGTFDAVKNKCVNMGMTVGQAVRDTFKQAVNSVFTQIEGRMNSFISALNAIRTMINRIPGVNISRIQPVQLPRLATGTVVPANYGEFQAILGDNKRAPEVVSPVPTMKQAVREVLNETGNSGKPIVIHNYVTLDGKVVYKTVVEHNNKEVDTTGINPLVGLV